MSKDAWLTGGDLACIQKKTSITQSSFAFDPAARKILKNDLFPCFSNINIQNKH